MLRRQCSSDTRYTGVLSTCSDTRNTCDTVVGVRGAGSVVRVGEKDDELGSCRSSSPSGSSIVPEQYDRGTDTHVLERVPSSGGRDGVGGGGGGSQLPHADEGTSEDGGDAGNRGPGFRMTSARDKKVAISSTGEWANDRGCEARGV